MPEKICTFWWKTQIALQFIHLVPATFVAKPADRAVTAELGLVTAVKNGAPNSVTTPEWHARSYKSRSIYPVSDRGKNTGFLGFLFVRRSGRWNKTCPFLPSGRRRRINPACSRPSPVSKSLVGGTRLAGLRLPSIELHSRSRPR